MLDRFWHFVAAYVLGLIVLVVVGMLPSEVETTYNWPGVLLMLALLTGLGFGLRLCRWVLIVLGVLASFGTLFLTLPRVDAAEVVWCVIALGITGLLLTPAMDRHADRTLLFGRRKRSV